MENKINIAELLKDCPKGMALDCSMFENLELNHIDKDDKVYPIKCRVKTEHGSYNYHSFNKHGCYGEEKYYKCVIFPKGKTTWKGFQRPFKDGDIVVTKTINNFIFYSIFKGVENREVLTYVDYIPDDNRLINVNHTLCHSCEIIEQRLATEEEKQKLFDAIKANGYKWNTETKTLEKLSKFKVGDKIQHKDGGIHCTLGKYVEAFNGYRTNIGLVIFYDDIDNWELAPDKFDINTLKPFDKVLVRDTYKQIWIIDFFSHKIKGLTEGYKFACIGHCWQQCVPYEGNEHLFNTTNDCDEFYKT